MQFGLGDNKRVDINSSDFEKWFEKYRFVGAHRSVYMFKPNLGFCTPLLAVVDHIYIDIDENPLEAIEILFNHYKEYRKIFITSGVNIHFLLEIEEVISPVYAPASLTSFVGLLKIQTDLVLDATSQNLMQMRRCPGSVNEKNGKVAAYFDPIRFEESMEPVVTGTKRVVVPVVKTRNEGNGVWDKKRTFSYENVDPFKIPLDLPGSYRHFDRIHVGRQLRNKGVNKERAMNFMEKWLPEEKYDHMLQEGIMDRIYAGKL